MKAFISGDVNSTIKDQLWPYTEYQIRIVAANNVGESEWGEPSEVFRTKEGSK